MSQPTDHLSPKRREIVEYLRRRKMASPSQMAEDLGRTGNSIRVMLNDMLEDGQVVRPIRGHYTVPGVADSLGLPVQEEQDSAEEVTTTENPLSGPTQLSLGMEEGRRRKGIALVAKTMLDSVQSTKEDSATLRAHQHPWWPMRTDVWAHIRWWIAEKLARMIVWLIPREELPNKDEIYGDR